MTVFGRLADFFGFRRSLLGLLATVLLVGLGEKMPEQFLPNYIEDLGGGAMAIALFGGLNNLLGALYSFPGGYLAERLGTKRALLLFNMLAMTGFGIVVAVPAWQAVLAGAALFLSWTAISLPATMGLVARVLPREKRTMGVSLHSLIRRFPMAVGPLLGGWFIAQFGLQTGVRLAFSAALLMALLGLALQQVLIEDDPLREREAGAVVRGGLAHLARNVRALSPDLRHLLFSDILIRFCEQIPYVFVVLWAMERITHPVTAVQFGWLRTVEQTTAALVYLPVAYLADRSTKKPFVLLTFVFFTLFPLVLLACHSFWPLVGAFVLRGLKEFGDATRKALILDLAPADRQALTFGVYYFVRDTIVSAAALAGGLLWELGPAVNFLTAFGFGVIGTIWFALRGRDVGPAPGGTAAAGPVPAGGADPGR